MGKIAWKQNQPIVKFLKRWVPICLPMITTVGGYASRDTETGSFSFHSEGRAADIYINAYDAEQLPVGDALFDRFIRFAPDLGVDHVIWNGQVWSVDEGGPNAWPAGRNPHTNHVHVAFTRDGSQQQPGYLIPILDGIHIELFGDMA